MNQSTALEPEMRNLCSRDAFTVMNAEPLLFVYYNILGRYPTLCIPHDHQIASAALQGVSAR